MKKTEATLDDLLLNSAEWTDALKRDIRSWLSAHTTSDERFRILYAGAFWDVALSKMDVREVSAHDIVENTSPQHLKAIWHEISGRTA